MKLILLCAPGAVKGIVAKLLKNNQKIDKLDYFEQLERNLENLKIGLQG